MVGGTVDTRAESSSVADSLRGQHGLVETVHSQCKAPLLVQSGTFLAAQRERLYMFWTPKYATCEPFVHRPAPVASVQCHRGKRSGVKLPTTRLWVFVLCQKTACIRRSATLQVAF
jgi:hypothetical protein